MNIYSYLKSKIRTYYIACLSVGFELFDNIGKIDVSKYGKLEMFDKEHFVKSEYSIIRKFFKSFDSEKEKYNHKTSSDVLDDLFIDGMRSFTDIFRMNIQINIDFQTGATLFLKEIKKIHGINLNNQLSEYTEPFKDSFNNEGGCKDFKVYFLYKGYPFEVQFHTPESELMNSNTHGLYEVYRILQNGDENKELLREDREKLYKTVKIPDFDQYKIMKEVFNYVKR